MTDKLPPYEVVIGKSLAKLKADGKQVCGYVRQVNAERAAAAKRFAESGQMSAEDRKLTAAHITALDTVCYGTRAGSATLSLRDSDDNPIFTARHATGMMRKGRGFTTSISSATLTGIRKDDISQIMVRDLNLRYLDPSGGIGYFSFSLQPGKTLADLTLAQRTVVTHCCGEGEELEANREMMHQLTGKLEAQIKVYTDNHLKALDAKGPVFYALRAGGLKLRAIPVFSLCTGKSLDKGNYLVRKEAETERPPERGLTITIHREK